MLVNTPRMFNSWVYPSRLSTFAVRNRPFPMAPKIAGNLVKSEISDCVGEFAVVWPRNAQLLNSVLRYERASRLTT
jgi:hypothetical protein